MQKGVSGKGGIFGVLGNVDPAPGTIPTALLAGVAGVVSSDHVGVYGQSDNATGVWGFSTNGSGVEGTSVAGHAGWFSGNVNINGKLSKSGGGFRIDHPLKPSTMYLNHSFVESPDMKNFYDGIVVLGPEGDATVKVPGWFEALNEGLRYQLTPIGAAAPELHIASEVRRGRFRIAGGRRGMKVCWQVTGIRQDRWAKHNRIKVEEKKTGTERGKYRHPEVFGKPEELSARWARDPELLRMLLKRRKRGMSLTETFATFTREMTAKRNEKTGNHRVKQETSRRR